MSTEQAETALPTRLSSKEVNFALPLWTQDVSARIVELYDRLPYVDSAGQQSIVNALEESASLVLKTVPRRNWPKRLSQWWTGSRVERAWDYLREAELLYVQHTNIVGLELTLDEVLTYANYLPDDDASRQRLASIVDQMKAAEATLEQFLQKRGEN